MSDNQRIKSGSEVHITYDDQQKINKFARLNAKYEDLKEEMRGKKNELQNLEDAIDELVLCDDSDQIMYQEGEIFIYKDTSNAQDSLEEFKNEQLNIIKKIESETLNLKEQIDELKINLYAKFGDNIHLEIDDE